MKRSGNILSPKTERRFETGSLKPNFFKKTTFFRQCIRGTNPTSWSGALVQSSNANSRVWHGISRSSSALKTASVRRSGNGLNRLLRLSSEWKSNLQPCALHTLETKLQSDDQGSESQLESRAGKKKKASSACQEGSMLCPLVSISIIRPEQIQWTFHSSNSLAGARINGCTGSPSLKLTLSPRTGRSQACPFRLWKTTQYQAGGVPSRSTAP